MKISKFTREEIILLLLALSVLFLAVFATTALHSSDGTEVDEPEAQQFEQCQERAIMKCDLGLTCECAD